MNIIFSESRLAEADLSEKLGYAVKQGTAGDGMLLGTAGACMGILVQGGVASGQYGTVLRKGVYEAAVVDGSGTAIAVGDPLTANSSGLLVKAATAGHMVIARARAAATTEGAKISVELLDAYPLPA